MLPPPQNLADATARRGSRARLHGTRLTCRPESLHHKGARAALAVAVLAVIWVVGGGCQSDRPARPVVETVAANRALAQQRNDQAYKLIEAGKFKEAEPILRQAIGADSSFGPAHNNLGIALLKQSRYYDAAWELESAAKLMPRAAEPHNNLGLVYQRAGKINASVSAFQKAHDLAPDNSEYLSNLAMARVLRGDKDEALRTLLKEVVFRDPRPQWQTWARQQMFRVPPPDTQPFSPAANPTSGPGRRVMPAVTRPTRDPDPDALNKQ
jgi:tetratricopeptide (TPR) repeat protein